jgi:LysM repeat protein
MTEIGAPRPVTLPVTPATAAVCPYLLSADGRWRASTPAREHRCTVITPPAVLAADKQRRLCLTQEHVGCSTYLAALAATDQTPDGNARRSGHDPDRHVRPVARTAPLLLDHGRLSIGVPALSTHRGAGQNGLVALMAVAFAAIVVARLSGGGPSLTPAQVGVGASASPSIAASAQPTATPDASAVAVASGPPPTLVPTEVEPTPVPAEPSVAPPASSAPKTYKVRSGDTLGAIAREFGTTAKVLMQLNGIDNPRLLHVGQVLKLP